jgi:hypothetical protein
MLCSGFAQPRAFWAAGLANVDRLGGNTAAGVPIGYFITDKDRPVGVVLTLASQRRRPDGAVVPLINLSSWYIAPEHRWRGPVMLRAILRHHSAMFTDLSPTPEVRAINTTFGFEPINRGLVITPLPAFAAGSAAGARVRDLDAATADRLPDGTGDLLMRHSDVGCFAAVLESPVGEVPLLFKPRRVKGLPVVTVVYCGSNAALAAHLPAVARYLLGRRNLLMIADDTGQPLRLGQIRQARGLKFAKPGGGLAIVPDRIDHAGSELCCLPF